MYWMFTGYLFSFYAALTAYAVVDLPSHPKPAHEDFAYFLLIPLLIAAFSSECLFLAPENWHKVIRNAIASGRFTKRYALIIGAVTGATVIALLVSAYLVSGFLESKGVGAAWPIGLVMLFVIALSPLIPGYWLVLKGGR